MNEKLRNNLNGGEIGRKEIEEEGKAGKKEMIDRIEKKKDGKERDCKYKKKERGKRKKRTGNQYRK